jgi:hypothetical protein
MCIDNEGHAAACPYSEFKSVKTGNRKLATGNRHPGT